MDERNDRSSEGDAAELASLRAALKDADARVRAQAARAIGYMGPDAAEVASDLVRLVANGTDAKEAMNALCDIGRAAVPHIMALLDSEQSLGRAVSESLQAIARAERTNGES